MSAVILESKKGNALPLRAVRSLNNKQISGSYVQKSERKFLTAASRPLAITRTLSAAHRDRCSIDAQNRKRRMNGCGSSGAEAHAPKLICRGCRPLSDCVQPPRRGSRIVPASGSSRGRAGHPLHRPGAALRPSPSAWSALLRRRPMRCGRLGSSDAPNGTGVLPAPVQPTQGIIPPRPPLDSFSADRGTEL
ncbi:hypothetical protein NDU88_002211 [Pleurodeles waltl]|uniref:Uncharacterized protein n=1 Tax=Pleurodeles waltl TaxID=8319 RepID=A0AAV7TK49_PLEWA|nr:hypothetical protein NDU88_002211 [Pleurodeles waltl]